MEDKVAIGICTGRPFGGTAVLVHTKLGNQTCRVAMDNPRMTAVRCQLKNNNDIIIASVYAI